ncbi:MAG TPA: hypothetical protein VGG74_20095 [Kofleriaceae bacterium]|jgi:hypothetical protein
MRPIALVIAVLVVAARPARAEPTTEDGCALARELLARDHDRAWRWNVGWGIGLAAAGIAQAIAAPLIGNRSERDTLYVGAIESGIGAASSLVLPLVVDPADEACADFSSAIAEAARRERNAFYLNHIGGLVVNLAGAAVLAHYTSLSNAALAFGVGYAVALVRTYTAPRSAWHATFTVGRKLASIGVATSF